VKEVEYALGVASGIILFTRDLFSFSTAEQIFIKFCVSIPHFFIRIFSIDLSIRRLSEYPALEILTLAIMEKST
jgi:hypothetical protein